MNKLKKILAFMLASVLLMGVFEVNAYAARTGYCTDVYKQNNPETRYMSGYKTNELNISQDRVYYYNCNDRIEGRTAYIHYKINGVDVGYIEAVGFQQYVGGYSLALCSNSEDNWHITDTELFRSTPSTGWHYLSDNANADFTTKDYHLYIYWGTAPAPEVSAGCGAHEHHFEYQTINEPTLYSDGVAGDVCTICGFAKNTQPVSAFGYAINDYATKLVNASKSGQVIKLELGEWNSFPKAFMEKVAAKSAQNVTFIFKYKWNHVKQEITIPAFSDVDTSLDWYGPATMQQLYGAN